MAKPTNRSGTWSSPTCPPSRTGVASMAPSVGSRVPNSDASHSHGNSPQAEHARADGDVAALGDHVDGHEVRVLRAPEARDLANRVAVPVGHDRRGFAGDGLDLLRDRVDVPVFLCLAALARVVVSAAGAAHKETR